MKDKTCILSSIINQIDQSFFIFENINTQIHMETHNYDFHTLSSISSVKTSDLLIHQTQMNMKNENESWY